MSEPRCLVYDIETAPIISANWKKWESNAVWIVQDWKLLSFAWKWLDEKTVHSAALPDFTGYKGNPLDIDDRKLTCRLWDLFDQADIIIAHNGNKFDQKKSKAKFWEHGLMPPSPYREIDTLLVSRRNFAHTSHSLNDLCKLRGIGTKVATGGAALWEGCMYGDAESWRRMVKYNKQDVKLLEALYLDLRQWDQNHPNVALISDKPDACSKCGSERPLKSHGWRYYSVTKRRVFRCKDCYSTVYGRIVEKSDVQYVN